MRTAIVLLLLAACAGRDAPSLNRPMYELKPDGSLACGTWATPGSVTPACDTATDCVCDFACIEDEEGANRSAQASFTKVPGGWREDAFEYGVPHC